jgi:hypothetical protein
MPNLRRKLEILIIVLTSLALPDFFERFLDLVINVLEQQGTARMMLIFHSLRFWAR